MGRERGINGGGATRPSHSPFPYLFRHPFCLCVFARILFPTRNRVNHSVRHFPQVDSFRTIGGSRQYPA